MISKIAVVGCGNMGMAFANGFLEKGLVHKENLLLVQRNPEKAERLKADTGAQVVPSIGPEITKAHLVIIGVKPQDFAATAETLAPFLSENQIILSLMAGISADTVAQKLGVNKIVRAMPNTPCMLGLGVTGLFFNANIDEASKQSINELMASTGQSVLLNKESDIDVVTALSGSGPAYFYYLAKNMVQAGVDLGFDENTSRGLIEQTMKGALALMQTSDVPLDQLIKNVASKGGTTQAALDTFDVEGVGKGVQSGLMACNKRAKELGVLFNAQ
jgi:pyrroline-5-carboxylate reductase